MAMVAEGDELDLNWLEEHEQMRTPNLLPLSAMNEIAVYYLYVDAGGYVERIFKHSVAADEGGRVGADEALSLGTYARPGVGAEQWKLSKVFRYNVELTAAQVPMYSLNDASDALSAAFFKAMDVQEFREKGAVFAPTVRIFHHINALFLVFRAAREPVRVVGGGMRRGEGRRCTQRVRFGEDLVAEALPVAVPGGRRTRRRW